MAVRGRPRLLSEEAEGHPGLSGLTVGLEVSLLPTLRVSGWNPLCGATLGTLLFTPSPAQGVAVAVPAGAWTHPESREPCGHTGCALLLRETPRPWDGGDFLGGALGGSEAQVSSLDLPSCLCKCCGLFPPEPHTPGGRPPYHVLLQHGGTVEERLCGPPPTGLSGHVRVSRNVDL